MLVQFDPTDRADRARVQAMLDLYTAKAYDNAGVQATVDQEAAELHAAVQAEIVRQRDEAKAYKGPTVAKPVDLPPPPPQPTRRPPPDQWNPECFLRFWAVVPHKIKRAKAEPAFRKAVQRVAKDSGMTMRQAANFIIERMAAWAKTPAANPTDRNPTHPSTWLNGGQYEDDPKTWEAEGGVPQQRKLEL